MCVCESSPVRQKQARRESAGNGLVVSHLVGQEKRQQLLPVRLLWKRRWIFLGLQRSAYVDEALHWSRIRPFLFHSVWAWFLQAYNSSESYYKAEDMHSLLRNQSPHRFYNACEREEERKEKGRDTESVKIEPGQRR